MKYIATIEERPSGDVVISFAIKCSKQDLTQMVANCSLPGELSLSHLRDRYRTGPASAFIQAIAQFVFWGELR